MESFFMKQHMDPTWRSYVGTSVFHSLTILALQIKQWWSVLENSWEPHCVLPADGDFLAGYACNYTKENLLKLKIRFLQMLQDKL